MWLLQRKRPRAGQSVRKENGLRTTTTLLRVTVQNEKSRRWKW